MQPVWLDEEAVRSRIDMPAAIAVLRSAFAELSNGAAKIPVRTGVEGEGTLGLFMPGWLPGERALGAKIVTVRGGNAGGDHPVVQALVVLIDPDTGAPEVIMDGTWLTALRTGAASGVATDLLARQDAEVLAVVGAGGQAQAQIEAVLAVRAIREVRIRSRGMTSAERLVQVMAARHPGVRFCAEPDPGRLVEDAGVIVTVTDSRTPVIPELLPSGVHINAVGAYTPEMREISGGVVARSRVFVDQRAAARAEAGDLIQATAEGDFGWDRVAGEIGEVVSGAVPGRRDATEITLFKSVGGAAQDLAVARQVMRGGSPK